MSDRDQQHAKIRAEVDAFLEAEKDQWDMDAAGGVGALEWNAYKLGATDFAFSEWNRNRAPVEPPVLSRQFLDSLIATHVTATATLYEQNVGIDGDLTRGAERLRDAILESLPGEEL